MLDQIKGAMWMSGNKLLDASCRVALAAYLHDLGKFAERSALKVEKQRLEDHLQLYARKHEAGGRTWYSHRHAAYTALAWDMIETHFPELLGDDVEPFGSWSDVNVDDSVINAASKHHKPETFLQWIVATADRVASGFEREEFEKYNNPEEVQNDVTKTGKNHFTARLLTLFEQIRLAGDNEHHRSQLDWRYPLLPLSATSLFPCQAEKCESDDTKAAQAEYTQLWQGFENLLSQIPTSHRRNWALWLDHFDSVWACFTQAIPSATAFNIRPEVSLYDHSHTTAALATALWRYHRDLGHVSDEVKEKLSDYNRPDWDEQKLLLVQGDLFGIQSFLFATGGSTQKKAAKLLRGRSFYVSLLTECAALKILDALQLPPTSQVINAAGKFLIVAPNTEESRNKLKQVKMEIDHWFLENSYGQAGIGIAWRGAACNDFLRCGKSDKAPFIRLIEQLFETLNRAKKQRLNLCGEDAYNPIFEQFLSSFNNDMGVCEIDGISPATQQLDGRNVSSLARDQVDIGKYLATNKRLLITTESLNHKTLQLPIFGYFIQFTGPEEASGKFGAVASTGALRRAWDFSLPESDNALLFNGYARRYINGYVPRFGEMNAWEKGRYDHLKEVEDCDNPRAFKSLEFIACDDRRPLSCGVRYEGVEALVTLKGDVDNLGKIFEKGLTEPSFAKMAALSRQMNAFFAIWLPWYCKEHYPSTYTVFAGGDDFFLIGPWLSTMQLARQMSDRFTDYVAHNSDIHFSAGLSMSRPGLPIRRMGDMAEEALEQAKDRMDSEGRSIKNAVTCLGFTVSWKRFTDLLDKATEIDQLRNTLELSTGYLYGLQYLADMAEDLHSDSPSLESALWNAHFNYRTWRMLERKRGLDKKALPEMHQRLGELLGGGIDKYGSAFKIALFTHLYQYR
jgi:CRISPR-associated protein Csm1